MALTETREFSPLNANHPTCGDIRSFSQCVPERLLCVLSFAALFNFAPVICGQLDRIGSDGFFQTVKRFKRSESVASKATVVVSFY